MPLHDAYQHQEADGFKQDVLTGLASLPKSIPPKYFYDERGSQLFAEICRQPEYYLTNSEVKILQENAEEMADRIGPGALFIEYGSGASEKIRILLNALQDMVAYVPVDISKEYLQQATQKLAVDYPQFKILPVYADYTHEFALPPIAAAIDATKVVFLPGSTVGNLEPMDARALLESIRTVVQPHGFLLIGVDVTKEKHILDCAYNDAAGVTAEFNKNLLSRINRELDGSFDLDTFLHRAFFNQDLNRIEMHLVSEKDQFVSVANQRFRFHKGESIHTENSYKYPLEEFRQLAAQAGMKRVAYWLDSQGWFSVQLFQVG